MEHLFAEKVDKSLSVIKHNTLVEAGYHLSPVPHNLMTLAVVKVKRGETGLSDYDKTGEVVITADEYAKIHNIDTRTAYKDLKKAVLELENASIRCDAYYDFNATRDMTTEQRLDIQLNSDRYHSNVIIGTKPKHGNYAKMKLHIKLVDRVGYSEQGSFVYFRFSDDVMYLIDSSEIDYTAYPYDKTVEMNITPIKRMYEMACKWVKIGFCKKSVDDWRHFFGLSDKYENISEFKRRVIEPAIKGVNKQGDFGLVLEQQKLGKTITHLIIKIKDKRPKQVEATKKDRDPNTPDIFDNLTDTERQIIAQKHAYADQIGADELHRQNLVRRGLEAHREAERVALEQKEREQAERTAQKAQDKADERLALQQFEQILADDELIQAYITANKINEKRISSGLQKQYFMNGDYRAYFALEKHNFEQIHFWRRLKLDFLD